METKTERTHNGNIINTIFTNDRITGQEVQQYDTLYYYCITTHTDSQLFLKSISNNHIEYTNNIQEAMIFNNQYVADTLALFVFLFTGFAAERRLIFKHKDRIKTA